MPFAQNVRGGNTCGRPAPGPRIYLPAAAAVRQLLSTRCRGATAMSVVMLTTDCQEAAMMKFASEQLKLVRTYSPFGGDVHRRDHARDGAPDSQGPGRGS